MKFIKPAPVLTLLFLLIFSNIHGQNELRERPASLSYNINDTIIKINDLVINSEKSAPFKPLVRVVAVIDSKEIKGKAVSNLPDLFRYIQGIDYKTRGSEGVQGDINILGGTFDQTMVMLNGVNITDPQTGHHSMNIPLEISQIDRIEVLQGPGAWSAGTMAFSGAVNIVTKEVIKNGANVSVTGGSFGYFRTGADATLYREVKGWKISGLYGGGYSRSDGFSSNTDFEIGNVYSNLIFMTPSGKSEFTFQSGTQYKSFGANSFYTFTYPEQYEKIKTELTSAGYIYRTDNLQVSANLSHRRLYDKFELFRNEAPQWYTGHNYHRNDTYGADLSVGLKLKKGGTLIGGGEFRSEQIISNVLGDPMDKSIAVPGEDGAVYTKKKGRNIPSVYLKHILQFENLRISSGVTISESYGTRVNGGVAVAWSLYPNFELNMWLNNSYRNPSFTDLYYKSPSQTGNTSLLPERAVAAQIGLRHFTASSRLYISSFYRYGSRIIDWIRESSSAQWEASNLTGVVSTGFEVSYRKSFREGFIREGGISYGYLSVRKNSGSFHSLYATDYLRHKASFTLNHKITPAISADWSVVFQERAGTYLDINLSEQDYKPFALVNVKFLWQTKAFDIFADISNIAGTKYFDLGNITQPGRWIKSGIIINL